MTAGRPGPLEPSAILLDARVHDGKRFHANSAPLEHIPPGRICHGATVVSITSGNDSCFVTFVQVTCFAAGRRGTLGVFR
jgi:hypothetical protein